MKIALMRLRWRFNNFVNAALSHIALWFMRFLRLLPPSVSIGFTARAARLIAPPFFRRKLIEQNIAASFPDLDEAARRRLIKDCWEHVGRLAGEFIHLDRLIDIDTEHPERGRLEVSGAEHFDRIKARVDAGGKPAIFFTAHTGNWELLAACGSQWGLDIASLYRPPKNEALAEKIMAIRGQSMGKLITSRMGAIVKLTEALEGGTSLGMLVDQAFLRGPAIPFLGRDAKTNPTIAKLIQVADVELYAARCVRLPGTRFRLSVNGPMEIPRDARGDVDVEALLTNINATVESWVREEPAQWFWLHNRWKFRQQ